MHEIPTVEIPVAELLEMAQGNATAKALLSLIHNKAQHYEGFSIEEVKILDRLYVTGGEED